MKIFLISFFFFFIFMSTQSKLVMLLSMHRHGARSTEKFFNHEWFPIGKKQLTPLGESQMKVLGSFYRDKYFPLLVNSDREIPIYISSPIKRCLDSAKHVYQGLFPNENNYLYNEIEVEFIKGWNFQFLDTIESPGFPIFVQKDKTDFLFHGFQKKICPKAHHVAKEKLHSPESLKKLEELRSGLFPQLSESLKKGMDIHIDPNEMSFSNMKGIYDVIVSTKAHKVPVDFSLSQKDFEKLTLERRDFVLNYKLGDPEMIRLSTSRFFEIVRLLLLERKKELLSCKHQHETDFLLAQREKKGFTAKADGEISLKFNRNMVLFSSHDTVMNLILNALLTKEDQKRLGNEMDLRYGSHLDLELRQEDDGLHIMVFLNEKAVRLTKCEGSEEKGCRFERFEGLLNQWISEDLEEECRLED